jgi:hypothetical protein
LGRSRTAPDPCRRAFQMWISASTSLSAHQRHESFHEGPCGSRLTMRCSALP